MSSTTTAIVIVLLTLSFILHKWLFSDRITKYPPGPPGLPILGNTLQVPPIKQWHYYMNLGKEYGPILGLSLGGDRVVILNKMGDANELLGKRAALYSSRPPLIYAAKYQSQNRRFVFLPYNNDLKRFRQAFHQMLQAHVPGSYERVQDLESLECLQRLSIDSSSGFANAKRYAGALIYNLTYGKRLDNSDSDLVGILQVLDNMVRESQPGVHLVDTFQWMDRLPNFLAPWRLKALKGHENEMKLYGRLIEEVKARMESDSSNVDCFGSRGWSQSKKLNLDLKGMAYLGGTSFEAGTGTLAGALLWFFSAALLFPEKIKLARSEIDRVLGADGETIPTFDHFQDLRYCYTLVKEVMRWQPSVPAGVPHQAEKDDVYKGYTINKGTIIIPNIYAMHHEEEDFPEPFEFKPERWEADLDDAKVINSETLLHGHATFGFGRRICPGRKLGATSLWIAVVRWIWAFDISPMINAEGNPIIPTDLTKCTSGITSEPEEFPLKMKIRSNVHAETIARAWVEAVSRGEAA